MVEERHYYSVYSIPSLVKQIHSRICAPIRVCMHLLSDTLTFMDFCTGATTTYRNCVVYYILPRHMVVCSVAQEAVASHCVYIDRKAKNVIFTPM